MAFSAQLAHSAHTLPTVAEQLSYPSFTSTINPLNEHVIEKLLFALKPLLMTHQQSIVNHIVDLNASIVTLTQDITTSKVQTGQVFEFHRGTTQILLGRLDRLEKFIGMSTEAGADGREEKSLIYRLDRIECMAGELLERVKDFESSNTARHEVGINTKTSLEPTKEEYFDTTVSASTPLNSSPVPPSRDDESTRCNSCLENFRSQSQPNIALQSNTLVPARSSQSAITSPIHSEIDDGIEFFIPDNSAIANQCFTLLPDNRNASPDGTITSLRRLLINEPSATKLEDADPLNLIDRINHQSYPTPSFLAPPSSRRSSQSTAPQRLGTLPPVDSCMFPLSPRTLLRSRSNNSAPNISRVVAEPSAFRSLSPLSSISSLPDDPAELTFQDAQLQPIPNTIIVRPITKASGMRKRKARSHLTLPPAKRTRRKTVVNRRKSILNPSDVTWPEKSGCDLPFFRKFILCDRCHLWYHCGCVGVAPGDIRLEPTEIYICPACDASSHEKATANVLTDGDQQCARPDCNQGLVGEFFVERIVGRAPKVKQDQDTSNDGEERKYFWLVKWDGYTISEATWESDEHMADPLALVAEFNRAAEEEGFLLDTENTIMLKEAVEGGWQSKK